MASAVSSSIQTLKSILLIIVLPILMGWMLMQKQRNPNLRQPWEKEKKGEKTA